MLIFVTLLVSCSWCYFCVWKTQSD